MDELLKEIQVRIFNNKFLNSVLFIYESLVFLIKISSQIALNMGLLLQAMSSCNHENVVSYHTSFVYKEELWLILRLLDAGSLLDIVRHKMKTQDCRSGVLDEVNILDIKFQINRWKLQFEYLWPFSEI